MVKCTWRYGQGASGKTHEVYELYDRSSIFHFHSMKNFFTDYKGQPTLVINYDESETTITTIMNLLDNNYVFRRKYRSEPYKPQIKNIEIISLNHPEYYFGKKDMRHYRRFEKGVIKIYYHYKEGELFHKICVN